MKLLLLCLTLPCLVAMFCMVLMLILHEVGGLNSLVQAAIGRAVVRLSGHPP